MSLVLQRADWPDADRTLWQSLMQSTGPLDDGGQLAHLRQTSRDTLQAHYGRWLKWLADTGPEALHEAPVNRATIERLQRWLHDLSHTRPMSQLAFVGDVVRLLRAAEPSADWQDHTRLVKHLRRLAGRGDPSRKAGRVLDSGVLLRAGVRLATVDAEAATTPLQTWKRQRDGAMVAFLAMMPIRRRAFASLRIGESIFFLQDSIVIALPEDLTKSGVPWEAEVPGCIAPLIRSYWLDVRPRLMARGGRVHDIFWVDDKGKPYELGYLGNKIGENGGAILGHGSGGTVLSRAA